MQVAVCDICDKRIPYQPARQMPHKPAFFATGREPDPSGNGSNAVGESFDLCDSCYLAVLLEHFRNPQDPKEYAHSTALIEIIRRRQKARAK
jgi:hypothetical protein